MFGWQNDLSNVSPKCCEVLGPPLSQSTFCFLPQRWNRNSSSKSKRSQPVLLCRLGRQAPSLLARFYLSRAPPLGPDRETGHPSPTQLPPRSPPRPVGRQMGPHLRDRPPRPPSTLRSPPGLPVPREAPLSPRQDWTGAFR